MRLYPRPSPFLLLLVVSVRFGFTLEVDQVADIAEGKLSRSLDATSGSSLSVPTTVSAKSPVDPGLGKKDAPVDGVDGRPHAGPFVETNADRDRKKAKESGDDEKKAPKDISTKGATFAEEQRAPDTNDGVMDDPNRKGPKEGTRGTEGGISEKNRDRKAQEGEIGGPKAEKKPDPPKEAPPLPHSEQEIVGQSNIKDGDRKGTYEASEKEEKSKELGGLEVIHVARRLGEMAFVTNDCDRRNPPICRRSPTISLLPPHQRR